MRTLIRKTMYKMKTYLLFSLAFVLLMACSSGAPGPSPQEKEYYQQMAIAHKELNRLQSFVSSSRFIKVRYEEALINMVGPTQEILKKYKGTEFESRESYQAALRAFESYVVAKGMWDQNKGMALVNQRLAEGKSWLTESQNRLREEKSPQPQAQE